MDSQLKKGILDICVLKCLEKKESYGYEIIKKLEKVLTISESTLYPILRRLEEGNYLTTHKEEHNGRLRKYYKINSAGLARIEEFKKEWKELKKIFEFILGGLKWKKKNSWVF